MAADEGLENLVAAEGNEGAVVGVGRVVCGVVGGEAVVEAGRIVLLAVSVACQSGRGSDLPEG